MKIGPKGDMQPMKAFNYIYLVIACSGHFLCFLTPSYVLCSLVTPYSVLDLEVNNKFSLKSDVPLGCAKIELNDVLHSSHGKCKLCSGTSE